VEALEWGNLRRATNHLISTEEAITSAGVRIDTKKKAKKTTAKPEDAPSQRARYSPTKEDLGQVQNRQDKGG